MRSSTAFLLRKTFLGVFLALILAVLVYEPVSASVDEIWEDPVEVPEISLKAYAQIGFVECPTNDTCVFAGSFQSSQGNGLPWVARRSGVTWSPIDYLGFTDLSDEASILDFKCTAVDQCVIIGVTHSASNPFLWVARQSNGVWATRTDYQLSGDSSDFAASCSDSTQCVFFQTVINAGNRNLQSIEYSIGGFSEQMIDVGIPNRNSAMKAECIGFSECLLTLEQFNPRSSFAYTRSAGVWSPRVQLQGGVMDITCTSPGSCIVVGGKDNKAWISSFSENTWSTLTTLPNSIPQGYSQWVDNIDCSSEAHCLVIGRSLVGSEYNHEVVMWVADISESSWGDTSIISNLNVDRDGGFSDAWTVSCGSESLCFASGTYLNRGPYAYFTRSSRIANERTWGSLKYVVGLEKFRSGEFLWTTVEIQCNDSEHCIAFGTYGRAIDASSVPWIANVRVKPILPATGYGLGFAALPALMCLLIGTLLLVTTRRIHLKKTGLH